MTVQLRRAPVRHVGILHRGGCHAHMSAGCCPTALPRPLPLHAQACRRRACLRSVRWWRRPSRCWSDTTARHSAWSLQTAGQQPAGWAGMAGAPASRLGARDRQPAYRAWWARPALLPLRIVLTRAHTCSVAQRGWCSTLTGGSSFDAGTAFRAATAERGTEGGMVACRARRTLPS